MFLQVADQNNLSKVADMDNNNHPVKRKNARGEHKSLRCFHSTRDIPIETYKMADDGRKWKALAKARKQIHRELASFADPDGTNCCPGLASLVRGTGHSRATVCRRIDDLKALGLLSGEKKSGYQGTRVYEVLWPGKTPIVSDSEPKGIEFAKAEVSDSAPIVSDSSPTVSDSAPIVSPMERPDRGTVIETGREPHIALCVSHARSAFKNKFHQEPTWENERREVGWLFANKSDLTVGEFNRRWNNYVDSTDPFLKTQGFSLHYFVKHFDSFMSGPLSAKNALQSTSEPPPKGYAQKEREEKARLLAEAKANGLDF